jgi:hypothetical protein
MISLPVVANDPSPSTTSFSKSATIDLGSLAYKPSSAGAPSAEQLTRRATIAEK